MANVLKLTKRKEKQNLRTSVGLKPMTFFDTTQQNHETIGVSF